MKIIDISVSLDENLPAYRGLKQFSRQWVRHYEQGHDMAQSEFAVSTHVGTHIDTPFHFIREGKVLEEVPLDVYYGKAQVVEVTGRQAITAADLKKTEIRAERVLIKTDNSFRRELLEKFSPDYVYLDGKAARYLVDKGVRLVGIDYFSVDRPGDPDKPAHRSLLGAGTIILEGINLRDVDPGIYNLICFPLKIKGGDGAPVRAVLVT